MVDPGVCKGDRREGALWIEEVLASTRPRRARAREEELCPVLIDAFLAPSSARLRLLMVKLLVLKLVAREELQIAGCTRPHQLLEFPVPLDLLLDQLVVRVTCCCMLSVFVGGRAMLILHRCITFVRLQFTGPLLCCWMAVQVRIFGSLVADAGMFWNGRLRL